MPYKDPQKKLERARQYRKEQSEAISQRKKMARSGKEKSLREYEKNYYAQNKDRRKDRRKEYMAEYNARSESKQKRSARQRREWVENPQYRLGLLLRSRLWYALKGGRKDISAVTLLGCSIEEAVNHIEGQFKNGMTWDNHGEWHIDHIIPLSAFNLECAEDIAKACHHTNLQPLWAAENLSKGARI